MKKKKNNGLPIQGILTLLSAVIVAVIALISNRTLLYQEKKYDTALKIMDRKTELYVRTVDIYQELINDLQRNLTEKILADETVPFTNEFGNIMNRNALYFDMETVEMMESSIRRGYWNMETKEIEVILKAMAREIRDDRKKFEL